MREVIIRLTPKPFEEAYCAEIVQELVRCKDCSHYGKDCVLLFPADGYCYDGKRREDGSD